MCYGTHCCARWAGNLMERGGSQREKNGSLLVPPPLERIERRKALQFASIRMFPAHFSSAHLMTKKKRQNPSLYTRGSAISVCVESSILLRAGLVKGFARSRTPLSENTRGKALYLCRYTVLCTTGPFCEISQPSSSFVVSLKQFLLWE